MKSMQMLMSEMFYRGDFMVARVECCTGETVYVVEDSDGNTIWEITQKSYNAVKFKHNNEHTIKAACGCVYHYITPTYLDGTTVLFDPRLN